MSGRRRRVPEPVVRRLASREMQGRFSSRVRLAPQRVQGQVSSRVRLASRGCKQGCLSDETSITGMQRRLPLG